MAVFANSIYFKFLYKVTVFKYIIAWGQPVFLCVGGTLLCISFDDIHYCELGIWKRYCKASVA